MEMDKSHFVKVAPAYYAVAIVAYFTDTGVDAASYNSIEGYYTVADGASPEDTVCYIDVYVLFDEAVNWLAERGLVREIRDDFGPSIYSLAPGAAIILEDLQRDPSTPFAKYNLLKDRQDWLRSALLSLNETYSRLGITREDFEQSDRDWEPLPLDRSDPQLQKAIGALNETIEQVRADNGYNATYPEERNYVLTSLSAAYKRLTEDASISVAWMRTFAFDPLAALLRRFKDAALGLIAAAAREALKEWLKRHGITILDDIFKS